MKLLEEINDIENLPEPEGYRVRKAARAVLFNDKNEIALLHVTKDNYYKLPGGGIDKGENIALALAREIKEEVGCEAEVEGEVGIIVEYRNKYKLIQFSYCYVAKVKGEMGQPDFTEIELGNGFELVWVSLDEAEKLIKNSKPEGYEGKFIIKRDLTFLIEALKIRS